MDSEDLQGECFLLRECEDLIRTFEGVVCLRGWVILGWKVILEWKVIGLLLHTEAILPLGEAQDRGVIPPGEAPPEDTIILPTIKDQISLVVRPVVTVEEEALISLGDYPEEAIVEAEGIPEGAELTLSEQSYTARLNLWRGSSARRLISLVAKMNRRRKEPRPGLHKAPVTIHKALAIIHKAPVTTPEGANLQGEWPVASNTAI